MMNFTKFRVNLYVSSAKTIIRLLKTNKILNYIWFSYPAGYQVGYCQTVDQNCFRIDGNNQELNKLLY